MQQEQRSPNKDSKESSKIHLIPLEKIRPNPNQPRQYFDEDKLKRLADSIKREGLHSPILVLQEGNTYKIIHGERRFRAHQMIGASHIKAMVVKGWDDKKVFVSAFLENDARDDLLPMETARALKRMMTDYNMTAEEVAKATQRSVSTVLNTISLLEEPPEVQQALNEGKLNLFQALTLRRVKNKKARKQLFEGLVSGKLPHKAFMRKVQEYVRVEKLMKMLPEVDPYKTTVKKKKGKTVSLTTGIPTDFKLYYVLGERMEHLVDLLPEKNVLVSAYTMLRKKNARPLLEKLVRDRDKINSLIVDSGLLSAIANGDKDWVNHQRDLIKLAEILEADYVTHMDCPLYKRVVDNWGVTQEEMWKRTIENAKEFKKMRTKATKIFSLQGYKGAEHYLQCLKEYERIGIFEEECMIGIGGAMARSNKLCYRVAELVREELDKVAPHTRIHFFGIANPKRIVELYKRGVYCYDAETEVLTKEGFKSFEDVTLEDEIATRTKDGFLEFHRPSEIQKFYYKGPMIHFGGKRSRIDLLVTPEHKMLVRFQRRNGKKTDWRLVPARDLLMVQPHYYEFTKEVKWVGEERQTFELPVPKRWRNELEKYSEALEAREKGLSYAEVAKQIGVSPLTAYAWCNGKCKPFHLRYRVGPFSADDWFEFLGWYLSEGSVSGKNVVCISQASFQKQNLDRISRLLKRMRLGFRYYSYREGSGTFVINNSQLREYLQRFGDCYSKFVPYYIKSATPRQIDLFLEAYMLGDGGQYRHKTGFISTASKRMADDILELLLKSGKAGTVRTMKVSGFSKGKDCYGIDCSGPRHCTPLLSKKPRVEEYEGFVYDVTVENHVIYVRRNGKCVWSGNSVDNVGPLAATINNLFYDEDGKTKRALFKSRLPREMFDASLIWNWHAYYYLLKQEFAKLKQS